MLVTTLGVQRELLRDLIHSHQLTCGRARTADGHARKNRMCVTFHQRDQRDPENPHLVLSVFLGPVITLMVGEEQKPPIDEIQ